MLHIKGTIMKTEQVSYFTEKEVQTAELLTSLGVPKNQATVLVYLSQQPAATSRAIERGTDLRQPEVSVAMSGLIEKGWVAFTESKSESKGRPVKVYKMKVELSDIIEKIRSDVTSRHEVENTLITKLIDAIYPIDTE